MTIESFLALTAGSALVLAFLAGLLAGALLARRRQRQPAAARAAATPAASLEPGHIDFLDIAPTRPLNPPQPRQSAPCAACETVAHCSRSGCVPISTGPVPTVLQNANGRSHG